MGLFRPTICEIRRMPDTKLPAVPKTIRKRRKRQQANKAARAKDALLNKVARKKKRVEVFKKAEKYAKEYRDKEREEIRLRREAKGGQLLRSVGGQVRLCHPHPWCQ